MSINVGVPANEKQDQIAAHYKVRIKDANNNVVTAYIGEGASLDLESTWDTPLESLTLGGVPGLATAAAIVQSHTGKTSKDISNTTKIWEGTEALTFNLPLFLRAYTNAKTEVEDAIEMLLQFASPKFGEDENTIPSTLTIDIGSRLMISECVIQSVSAELDPPRTEDGYMATNNVQLTVTRMFTTSSGDLSMGQMGGVKVSPGGEIAEAALEEYEGMKSVAQKATAALFKAGGTVVKAVGEFK